MIDNLFSWCCDIIRYVASLLEMSYSACNILIFLHILPAFYLFLVICLGISGFFKKSKIFGIICIIISGFLSLYGFEFLFYTLSEFTLDEASFNKAVEILQRDANLLNCTYQEINILYFIIVPIIIVSFLTFLILYGRQTKTNKRQKSYA